MAIDLPTGYAIAAFDSLASTNQHALKLANEGEFSGHVGEPLIVYTKNQTAGRGRNGRTWLSSDKTLTATILLTTSAPKAKVAQLAFVMAIAAHKTICGFLEASKHKSIGVKWPNDILVQGRKLAGILIESSNAKSRGNTTLAIGIGMNIGDIPEDGDFSATSLLALDVDISIEQVLSSLAFNFDKFHELWSDGAGFAAIRKIWLDHALGLGGKITARLPNHSIHGIFESLNEDGILILRDEAGKIHQITAGDIFIGHI
ncbi:MAG: biotin--[acetyl-CoA-carboxylase] ligase [Hyphomicrobiales bacterium]